MSNLRLCYRKAAVKCLFSQMRERSPIEEYVNVT
jgi:hypothetical protein